MHRNFTGFALKTCKIIERAVTKQINKIIKPWSRLRLSVGSHSISHTKKPCNLDRWPMTLKLSRVIEVVKAHVHAKLQQAMCSGSWR